MTSCILVQPRAGAARVRLRHTASGSAWLEGGSTWICDVIEYLARDWLCHGARCIVERAYRGGNAITSLLLYVFWLIEIEIMHFRQYTYSYSVRFQHFLMQTQL